MKVWIYGLFFLFLVGLNQGSKVLDRRERLVEGLRSEDWDVELRAVQELGGRMDSNEAAYDAMLKLLFSNDISSIEPRYYKLIKVLGRTRPVVVDKILRYYRGGEGEDETLEGTLGKSILVLGRIGRDANEAIPFLLEQLEKSKNDEIKASLRVVLGSIGYKSDNNLARIASDIRGGGRIGKSALSTLAKIAGGFWVTDKIKEEIGKWLLQGNPKEWLSEYMDESAYAAIALACLGGRTEDTQKRLATVYRYVQRDDYYSTLRIALGVPLTKMSPVKKERGILRGVMKYMGSEEFGNHTDFAALAFVDYLLGPEMVEQIGAFLNDKDAEVVRGAALMVWFVGYRAKQYAPNMLKILGKSKDEDARKLAAQAMGQIGDPCDIPALVSIYGKEQSVNACDRARDVCEELSKAIRVIKLEKESKAKNTF